MERKHEVILHRDRDKGLAALPFPDTRLMLWLISLRGWLPSCPLSSVGPGLCDRGKGRPPPLGRLM